MPAPVVTRRLEPWGSRLPRPFRIPQLRQVEPVTSGSRGDLRRESRPRPSRRQGQRRLAVGGTGRAWPCTSIGCRSCGEGSTREWASTARKLQAALEHSHLLLQPVDPSLEFDQLGAKCHLVDALLQPVHPLLEALQTGHDRVVLGLKPVEALVYGIEMTIDLIELRVQALLGSVHGVPDDALNVRNDDLPVETGQERKQVLGHERHPTPRASLSSTRSRRWR
jgi:hypothetical protein